MHVDLSQPAKLRWMLSPVQSANAVDLMAAYQRDLGLPANLVSEMSRSVIPDDYWNEMEGIASRAGIPVDEVVCGNLYYDALKAVLVGCAAFAVDTPGGPLHARNLDWWTENTSLQRFTMATRFTGAAAGEFTTIGWPGSSTGR